MQTGLPSHRSHPVLNLLFVQPPLERRRLISSASSCCRWSAASCPTCTRWSSSCRRPRTSTGPWCVRPASRTWPPQVGRSCGRWPAGGRSTQTDLLPGFWRLTGAEAPSPQGAFWHSSSWFPPWMQCLCEWMSLSFYSTSSWDPLCVRVHCSRSFHCLNWKQ